MKIVIATGRGNGGAGAMSAPGAAVGDRVAGLMWQGANGELVKVANTLVEAAVTVADQLQTPYPLRQSASFTGGAPVYTDHLGATSASPGSITDRVPDYSNGTFVVLLEESRTVSANGAVGIVEGVVHITKGTAAALTIADPANVADDGKVLTIVAATAAAHTLSNAAGSGFNAGGASSDVATFGGAVGDNIVLRAYGGKWLVGSTRNVTLA